MRRFEVASVLPVQPSRLWPELLDARRVNAELAPWLRMTFPQRLTENIAAGWQPGVRQHRSWILLFGLLPVEYDDLTFESVDPPRGFRERSTLLSQRRWCHERTLTGVPEGCLLLDRLSLDSRLRCLEPLSAWIFERVFRWRHRRLRRYHGGRAALAEETRARRGPGVVSSTRDPNC